MQNVNFGVLFLAGTIPMWLGIVFAVIGLAVGAVIFLIYKATSDKKVGSAKARVHKIEEDAKAEAARIVSQGKEESKRALKEGLLEVKEQDLKLRNEFERETKEKRAELQFRLSFFFFPSFLFCTGV